LKAAINTLFAFIKTAYPHFLKDQDVQLSKRLWAVQLHGYAIERIENAASLMLDRHPSFPPTIGEFKKLLAELNVAKPEHEYIPRLPPPEANDSKAREQLDKIMAMLR